MPNPRLHGEASPRTSAHAGLPGSPGGVAICSAGELFGGVERCILMLLAGLRARGVAASVLLFHRAELAVQAGASGFDVTVLPNANRALLATSRALADHLSERGIRLVHAHGYKAMVFCAAARRFGRLAVVKTEHGLPEPVAGSPLVALRGRFYTALDAVAARRARATLCYVTAELMRCRSRLHRGLVTHVVPNGIDGLDRASRPRPPGLPERAFNALIVGRLEPVKGHPIAIAAMADPAMPADVHLHVIGVGAAEGELRALAAARRVDGRVHFHGFRRDVLDFLAHCDAVVMPSLHEGLPYVLLEAMALATPMIASRVGGLAEVVEDGESGLLIAPGSREALVAAVRRLHSDAELRAKLGRNARSRQRERYSLHAMTERYLAIYGEALGRAPA